MSWEEMSMSKTVCPCGKGRIIQKHYGDDWNRFKDGPVIIECEDCEKKYRVEEVFHSARLASDGSWTEYFLVPKDYPEYSGPNEDVTYGSTTFPAWNFTGWLIENYTEEELKDAEKQLCSVKSSAALTGVASEICKEHKRALKTVRVSSILASVKKGIDAYPNYVGNKQQRSKLRKRESKARQEYLKEKSKHQIAIHLK